MAKPAELAWRRGHARTAHSMAKWVPDDEFAEPIIEPFDDEDRPPTLAPSAMEGLADFQRQLVQMVALPMTVAEFIAEQKRLELDRTRAAVLETVRQHFPHLLVRSHPPEPCSCHHCGCTDMQACVDERGPCWWVEPGLCSHCAWPLPNPCPPGELKPDGYQVNELEP